jgi:hypothetical protein
MFRSSEFCRGRVFVRDAYVWRVSQVRINAICGVHVSLRGVGVMASTERECVGEIWPRHRRKTV